MEKRTGIVTDIMGREATGLRRQTAKSVLPPDDMRSTMSCGKGTRWVYDVCKILQRP